MLHSAWLNDWNADEKHDVIQTTEYDIILAVEVEKRWMTSERSISLTKTSK